MTSGPTTPLPPHPGEPLRILFVHNRYQQAGGEDSVVESEVAMLRARGHAVSVYQRSNDDIDDMAPPVTALQALWSSRTARDLTELVGDSRAQLVHSHNTFPLVSPSLYWAAARLKLPVVQSLHNFRLICPQAHLLREGRPCEDCVGHLPWRSVVHACYRESRAQSAVLATMLVAHRVAGTWERRITRYIALNAFCRDRFVAGGLPADRIRVKPNFVDIEAQAEQPRSGFLFVGRLCAEKGVSVLAGAMQPPGPGLQVRVAGTGPLAYLLQGLPGLSLLGQLPAPSVHRAMREASALVLPSVWYENFPRIIVEAAACGLPIIASRIGALPSLVEHGRTGMLFDTGDPAALRQAMDWAQANPLQLAEMGRAARRRYESEWTADANYPLLMNIYREALAASAARTP